MHCVDVSGNVTRSVVLKFKTMASRSVNKVILIGHLGRDAETKFTPSQVACTKFSVATNRRWKDQQTGEWKEETDWHNVTIWRAENVANYLQKGKQVYVEGRLQTRSYEQDGRWHALHSREVGNYIAARAGGHFTAKEFRTWNATVLMALALANAGPSSTLPGRKRRLKQDCLEAARQGLRTRAGQGNTDRSVHRRPPRSDAAAATRPR